MTSNIDSTPVLPIFIKQEVFESNEILSPDINNEFHVKEEILSDSEDLATPEARICAPQTLVKYENTPYHCKSFTEVDPEYELNDEKILFCTQCTYKTKRRSHLNDHLRRHTGDKPYQCGFCDYKSGLKGNLKRHTVRIHDKSEKRIFEEKFNTKFLKCAHCNYVSPNKSLLIKHMKIHVLFQTKTEGYNLRSHSLPKYNETLKIEQVVKTESEFIDIHSLNIDPQGNLMIAPIKYEQQYSPTDQFQNYSYKCQECTYTCMRKTHLNDHLKTHSGEKPFVCTLCQYRTGHKSHLTRHLKVHTKKEDKVVIYQPPPPPAPLKKQAFRCLLCGYKSMVKHCFAKHMRLHIGIALYTCNICDFEAKSSVDIKNHIKIHQGQSEFGCGICNYKSSSKGRLRRHMSIHNKNI